MKNQNFSLTLLCVYRHANLCSGLRAILSLSLIAENMARQMEEEANRMIQEVLGYDNKWSDGVINRANRIKYNI